MAARLDLLVQQGSDFSRTMLFQRAGVPLDLTGYSFAGQIRKNINDTTVVAEFGFELFDQTGADKGKVRFFLTSAQTGAITLKAQKGQIKTSEPFDGRDVLS